MSLRKNRRLKLIYVAGDEIPQRLRVIALRTEAFNGILVAAERVGILDVDVLTTKLQLVATKRVAYILIHLSQVLWPAEARGRICRVVGPVTGHRDGIASDCSRNSREHEKTWPHGIGAVELTVVYAV